MNRRAHKKKKNRGKHDYKGNKENGNADSQDTTSREHNVSKVTDDKKVCYEVKRSDEMGRYLVASRDIAAGEIIMRQPALAVGPCAGCSIVCLGCYRELDDDYDRCKKCKWPVCGAACAGVNAPLGHSNAECETLDKVPPNYSDLEDLKESYHALMPLRCLLLKKFEPDKWSTIIKMESHNEIRRSRKELWESNERLVVKRLLAWGLGFESEEIHTICGILEVNAFEVGSSEVAARALYDGAFYAAHSCVPSTTHTDAANDRDRPLLLRAAIAHARGDLITLSYAYTLQGTLKRREHIEHSKFFSCACSRCRDPTELSTHAGAFICPRCAGRVQCVEPLTSLAKWRCVEESCVYTMTARDVHILLNRLTDEVEALDPNDVEGFEHFLHKYRNVLHPNHYLCLSAKHSLSQLYGKVAGYMIQEMPESQLQRKIEICRDLMKVFDVLEPGYSRLRGVTLYELHAPLMILTTRAFEKKAIIKEELRTRLKEIVRCLTEAALILGFEPTASAEGLMAAAAKDALSKIAAWETIIGKI